jgi:3-methyl-2-oxobutanoate hydroxymethyltransferase
MSIAGLRNKKRRNQKITLLTAYDFPMASFLDQAGIDMILVSDAVGTIGNGRPEAVSVTVDEMIYHTQAVRNGVKFGLVVTTLPYGSYSSPSQALTSATRIMKEAGGCVPEGWPGPPKLSAGSWNRASRSWGTSA